MDQNIANSIVVAYDEKLGIVFHAPSGSILTTTSSHAKTINEFLEQYKTNNLVKSDKSTFERYISKAFSETEERPLQFFAGIDRISELGRLEILLATDCNLNCKYCYAHGGQYGCEKRYMDSISATRFLDQLIVGKYRKVKIVMLFGGEPTLQPDTINTICQFFKKQSDLGIIDEMPIFTMVSNGTLISDQLLKTIREFDIRITISLDGPIEINDKLRVDRQGRGTYQVVSKNIQKMNEYNCPPRVIEATYTSLHDKMGYSKTDIDRFLKDTFNVQRTMIANCIKNGVNDHLVYNESDYNKGCKDYENDNVLFDELKLIGDINSSYYCDISCSAGLRSFALLPDGSLYPCHSFAGNLQMRMAFYDGNQFNFDNLDTVKNILLSLRKTKNPGCVDCWAKGVCDACPATIFLHLHNGLYKEFCEIYRENLKGLLLHITKIKSDPIALSDYHCRIKKLQELYGSTDVI